MSEETPETISQKLQRLGITLPTPPTPLGSYRPFLINGSQLYVSGQLPLHNGSMGQQGVIGDTLAMAHGQKAARLCAINILAQANAALEGDLERIVRVVKLTGFIVAIPHFYDHALVMNGASDFMHNVFGEAGRHVRSTVGVATLPRGASVEVDALFEIR